MEEEGEQLIPKQVKEPGLTIQERYSRMVENAGFGLFQFKVFVIFICGFASHLPMTKTISFIEKFPASFQCVIGGTHVDYCTRQMICDPTLDVQSYSIDYS
jgi:hypothetical protein